MPICLTKGELFSKVVTVNAEVCQLVTLLERIDKRFLRTSLLYMLVVPQKNWSM